MISAFEVKVDTMTVLRTSRQIESELFKQASPTKVVSVVAFACAPTLRACPFLHRFLATGITLVGEPLHIVVTLHTVP